jgi:hypothetical protein
MVIDRDSTQGSRPDFGQDSRKRRIVLLLLAFASLFLFALIYSLLSSLGFSLHPQTSRQPAPEIRQPDRVLPNRVLPNRKPANRIVMVNSARVAAPLLL